MADIVLGMNCKFYYKDTPLVTDPDRSGWTEIDNVRDLNQDLTDGESDVTTRGNNGFRQTASTLTEGAIDFEMVFKPSDTALAAFMAAKKAKGEIALAAMSGDITETTTEGLAGNFRVMSVKRNEPLEEAVKVQITVKPSSYTLYIEAET